MLDRDDNLDHAIDEAVFQGQKNVLRVEQADAVIMALAQYGYEIVKKEPTDAKD